MSAYQVDAAHVGALHVFERAGLGLAPFRYVGSEWKTYRAAPGAPVQPGGSCDYCGTGICEFCWIASADGHRFKVGNECVRKTSDAGLINAARRDVNRHKRERAHAAEAQRAEATRALLARDDVRAQMSASPHPAEWGARQGKTLTDWAEWMMANAGAKGRATVAARLRAEGVRS